MYQKYFGLAEMPFSITPDPKFLYPTPQHKEALGKCKYVISERGGLVAIYGDIGMGKTTIARSLVEDIKSKDTKVAMLITPAVKTETQLLTAIMREFGIAPKRSYGKSLQAFYEFIAENAKEGINLVAVIDEAQKVTPRMFDVIHSLLNFESNTQKFLQVVLIGQNELAVNIDKMPNIKSRVAIFGQLSSLTKDDAKEMIAFRWQTASGGKTSDPFTDDALESIYRYSHGLPREINKLCHFSLLRAYYDEQKEVNAQMVEEAAKDQRLATEVA
jgi:general secretion pathway protein A